MMPQIEIRQSRGKLLLMMLSCALMVAAGVAMFRGGSTPLMIAGVVFILLFAGLFAYLFFRFCKPPLLLTLGPAGFIDHSKSNQLGFVGWEKVHNVSLLRNNGEMLLSVLMDDPDGIVEKVSKGVAAATRKKGDAEDVSRLPISTAFMGGKPKAIYEEMVARVQAYREEKCR